MPADFDAGQRDSVLQKIREAKPVLIASGGPEATMLALEGMPGVPVVFFMVPNAQDAFADCMVAQSRDHATSGSQPPKRLSGVTSDVSPAEWIAWIREVQPDGKHLGVLFSERSQRTAAEIEKAGAARDLSVHLIKAGSEDFPKAINDLAAEKCDSVLMIPDAKVYNGPNIQRLLLWGIRTKTPVWAFSSKIVKAGAPSGQYAPSREVGRQAADLVWQICTGADSAKIGIQYPTKISRAVNERSSELIGLRLSKRTLAVVNERLGGEP